MGCELSSSQCRRHALQQEAELTSTGEWGTGLCGWSSSACERRKRGARSLPRRGRASKHARTPPRTLGERALALDRLLDGDEGGDWGGLAGPGLAVERVKVSGASRPARVHVG